MRTNWLLILAMASATTAWPWKRTESQNMVVRRAAWDQDHNLIYVRDTTTTSPTTTTTAADTTTTDPTTTSTTTSASSTTTTSSTTSTTTSSTSTTSTTATSTTASTTTTSSTATTSSASTTTTASSTTSTSSTTTSSSTSSSTTTSSSTSSSTTTLSASAAAELRAWNHTGEIRAIVVFSILGGVALGFILYALITSCARKRQNKFNRLSTAGSSYSIIPLTAEGKDDARTLRESRMFS